ncbi:unnamed protein product [Clonostachys chloroleuca]|uniref:G domain-containing protein n=1 Tax=Clonostachys chloroleuca TaxID=1926264 RepID=A0AA35QBG5_9HYPO|nr:unnamed protein product [Clonostachys chloroleuca]
MFFSVTQEYQLWCARIDGEFYIFVDTPGFDDPKTTNEEVFRNIVDCVEAIKDYAIFTGILYVHKLDSIYSAGQSVFIDWLQALCGSQYLQRVTFVTTKWDEIAPIVLEDKLAQLEEWTEKWSVFLKRGALMYHHGKKYDTNGIDLGIILAAKADGQERRRQARSMISRHYKGKQSIYPLLVLELKRGTNIEDTAAGQSLGIQRPVGESTPQISRPNWFGMFVDLLLWPLKRLQAFVSELTKYLPHIASRQRIGRKGMEIIITMPLGAEIALGWGGKGLYVDSPPDDLDGEDGDFEVADEWDGNGEDLFAGFGDTPDERLFAEAFRQAMDERGSGRCLVM